MSVAYKATEIEDGRFIKVEVLSGKVQHGNCCHGSGSCFVVKRSEGECYLKDAINQEAGEACPFPAYCVDGDIGSIPLGGFKNYAVLTAGVPLEVVVPSVGDCCPAYVHFTSCGGCVYAAYGTDSVEPVAVPDASIDDGTGPDMNPSIRTLYIDGEKVTVMSLISDVDTVVQLDYFGV